jgi:hypothetical protein
MLAVASCGRSPVSPMPGDVLLLDEDDAGGEFDARVGDDAVDDATADASDAPPSDTGESDTPRPDGGPDDTGDDIARDTDAPDDGRPDVEPPIDVGPPDTGGPTCGNGVVDRGETCDGTRFVDGATCESLGFGGGGALRCNPDCTISTRRCLAGPVCGDGAVDPGEDCDGAASATCEELGFAPGGDGRVRCNDRCTFDTSRCQVAICGNTVIDSGETCDTDDFGEVSCEALGFLGGELRCVRECSRIDESRCVSSVCGDGRVDGDEVCDGAGSVTRSCASFSTPDLRYFGGVVGCSRDCAGFDLSRCSTTPPLGDRDGDGVEDDLDNCPDTFNPNQLDFTRNGVGNVCDDVITYDVVVDDPTLNRLRTTAATTGSTAGLVSHGFDRVVNSGRADVRFDDDGVASVVRLEVGFADSEEVVSAPGGFASVTMRITEADMALVGDAIVVRGSEETYASGETGGSNTAFTARFRAIGFDGTRRSSIDVSPTIDSSTSQISASRGRYQIQIEDADVALGTVRIEVPRLGASEVAVRGLRGTIALDLN